MTRLLALNASTCFCQAPRLSGKPGMKTMGVPLPSSVYANFKPFIVACIPILQIVFGGANQADCSTLLWGFLRPRLIRLHRRLPLAIPVPEPIGQRAVWAPVFKHRFNFL